MARTAFVISCALIALPLGSCLKVDLAIEPDPKLPSDGNLATPSNNATHARDRTNATAATPPPDSVPIVFAAFGSARSYAAVAAAAASIFGGGAPVYVITDGAEKFSGVLRTLAPCKAGPDLCARVHAVDMSEFQGSGPEESFKRSYIHCSINTLQYERPCFLRFFWLQQFMAKSGVGRALWLDADILLAGDVAEAFDLNSKPFFALYPWSSFFSFWTLGTLSSFCEYMQGFYARPVAQIAQDVEKYGHPKQRRPKPPRGWPATIKPRHFSDTWMLGAFLDTHPELGRFVLADNDSAVPPGLEGITVMERAFGGRCFPDGQWQAGTVNGRPVHIPTARASAHKLLAMHFQGRCKGMMLALFNKMMGASGSEGPKALPRWDGRAG